MRTNAARLFLFLFCLTMASCTYRKEEVPEPAGCDTTDLKFSSGAVSVIISTRCAVTGCHVAGTAASGDFTSYSELKARVDNGTFNQRLFVLMDMPQTGSLTDCERAQLKAWLNDGAPQ